MSQSTKFPYDIPGDFECGCYEEVNIKLPEAEFSQFLTVEEQILYLYNEIEELKQGGDLPDDILQRITNLETAVTELDTKTDNIEVSITNINQEISNIKASIEVVKSDISSLTLRVDTAETDITEAKAGIVEAKTTANNALTTANESKSTAESATTVANEAKSTAESASTTANEAKTTAENISSVANEAKTTAENAVTTANEANTTAENAETVANEAKTSAESVVTIANEAKSTAESAATAASTAQTTAEEAKTSAESASSAASTAQTKAENAQTAAESAATAASTAQTKAENAQTAAESAATAASTAQTTANEAMSKASDWKLFFFSINVFENTPNRIYLGNYTAKTFSSDESFESLPDDNSNSFKDVFNINACTVVKSDINDTIQFNYRIYFYDTLKQININKVNNVAQFDCNYTFSGLYRVIDYEYVTLSIPLEFQTNCNGDYIFEDYDSSNVVIGTLPAEFYLYYANASGEADMSTEETSFRSITFSIGKCDGVRVLLITIPVKPTRYYSNAELQNMHLKYFNIKSI